jgi:hypothetical protein
MTSGSANPFELGAPLIMHVDHALGAFVLQAVPMENKVDFVNGVACYLYCRRADQSDHDYIDVGAVVMYQPELLANRITSAILRWHKPIAAASKPMSAGARRQRYKDAVARNAAKARGAG